MTVVLFSQLLFFELIQQAARVDFIIFLNILRMSKISSEHYEKETDYLLSRVLFFT